jgi:REP element-mobilizing transposase RayT
MSRGDRQEAIFRDDTDREMFLDTLEEACSRTGWRVHAFCLMGNHYHLLIETPEANLVAGMKWLQGTYTQRFNARHELWGHLFQGRYKAIPVEADGGDYFSVLAGYIHLNPARAKLFDLEKGRLSDFAWSSFPLVLEPDKRPGWLRTDRVLRAAGLEDTVDGRSAYEQRMQKRVLEILCSDSPYEVDARWAEIRRGWYSGGELFRQAMLAKLDDVIGVRGERASFCGAEVRLHDEAEAERLVCKGLSQLGLTGEDLLNLPKGAEEKKALVAVLKKRTSAGNKWIAARLNAGHAANIPRYRADAERAAEGSSLRKIIKALECED